MEQLPDRVDLAVGEEQTVVLPGLGTAGYMWQEQIVGPADVVNVTWQRGFPPGTEPAAVGVSAPERATIHAVGPGEVTLRFVQVRHWERGVAPIHEHRLLAHVTRSP